jgi:hypothetical protein
MSEFGETKISDLPIGDRLKTSLLRELSSMKYLSNPRDTVAALKEYIGFDEDEDRTYAFQSLGRIRGIGKKSVDLVWYTISGEPIPKTPGQIAYARGKAERLRVKELQE